MYIFIIIAVIILIVVVISLIEINSFETTHFTVENPKVKKTFKIVFISDLHNRKYDLENQKIYGAIDNMAPNVVLIGGDMIVRGEKPLYANALNLIKKLSEKYKVIYVNGNHEQKMEGQINDYYYELEKAGVILLKNSCYKIENINFFGLEIDLSYYSKFRNIKMDNNYIEENLGVAPRNELNLLIAHNPSYFPQYASWGADIVMSGHVHGGMIRLPLLGGLLSSQGIFFPKYSSGLYKYGNSKLIVSKGLGSHTVNIRVNNKPEIVCVEIVT